MSDAFDPSQVQWDAPQAAVPAVVPAPINPSAVQWDVPAPKFDGTSLDTINANKAQDVWTDIKGGIGGGIVQGLRDPIDGVVQIGRNLPSWLGGKAIDQFANYLQDHGVPVDAKTANDNYEAARAIQGRTGFDAARLMGNIANPVNRIVPMGGIEASLGSLAARGATQGAISGLTTPVEDPSASGLGFAGQKVAQTLVGAGAAGVLSPVGASFMHVGNDIGSRIGAMVRGVTPADVEQAINKAAAAGQIDLSQIHPADLANVRSDVAAALAKGQTLDPAAAARMSEGTAVLGADSAPTVGQATRDPIQFTQERNLAKTGANGNADAAPLVTRIASQSKALVNATNALMGGAQPMQDEALGNVAYNALRESDKASGQNVTDLYNAFRSAGGADKELPGTTMAQAAGNAIDQFGEENIPGAVMKKLSSYGFLDAGDKTKSFNLDEADKLLKVINANYDPTKKAQARALDGLRGAVRQTFEDEAGSAAGSDAADLYPPAVSAAKARFDKIESTPAIGAAVDNAEPNQFFSKYVLSGSPRQMQSMSDSLTPEAKDAVRVKIINELKTRALSGSDNDDATFSQSGFNRSLKSIGDERLAAFFSPEEIAGMHRIGRVAFDTQYQPAGSAVNNSNTAAAAYDVLSRFAAGLPFVKNAVEAAKGTIAKSAVSNALSGKVPSNAIESNVNALRPLLPALSGAGAAASSELVQ